MEIPKFIERANLLNLPALRRQRPDWTDRLPYLHERPSYATRELFRRRWTYFVPSGVRDAYHLWLARRRCRLYTEQIEKDELDEVVAADDDSREVISAIYAKHAERRDVMRAHVYFAERPRLERLGARWDVDVPKLVSRGIPDVPAFNRVRRAVRDARWLFAERCAKVLIPILSLLVALVALLSKR